MGLDSDAGFLQGVLSPSFYNPGEAPFWRGATVNASQVVLPAVPSGSGGSAGRNEPPLILPKGSPPGSILADPAPGLNHDNNQVVNWSWEEQALLKQGLVRFVNEATIMKYIKIAATLREKTVRDVALRCQWIKKREQFKRRKPEGNYTVKNIKGWKEKTVDCSPLMNVNLAPPRNFPTYHPIMHDISQSIKFSNQVPAIDSLTDNLLEENAQILRQVDANITSWKLQDNIDLIVRANNNISAILYSMSEMPGMMRRMPPLPVSVDDVLVHSMLHNYSAL